MSYQEVLSEDLSSSDFLSEELPVDAPLELEYPIELKGFPLIGPPVI